MLSLFDDAQLDKEACLEFLKGNYDFDLLPLIPGMRFSLQHLCPEHLIGNTGKLVSLKQLSTVKPSGDTTKVRKIELIKFIQTAFLVNESVLFTEISPNNTPK